MKQDTHEFPLRIGLETTAALRRYQLRHGLETLEEAARSCLRAYLSDNGFVEFDADGQASAN